MALGKSNDQLNGKLYVLRIKNNIKDKETGKEIPLLPHQFEVSEKIDGKWVVSPNLETRVSGDLVKIEVEDKEYEGNPYKAFKFFLRDGDETYLLDLRSTMVSRNLFNSILALNKFEQVQISLYSKKSKKDEKEYTNISLWQDGVMVKGKFSLDEIPKPEEVKNKQGKIILRQYGEVDEFFAKNLIALSKQITPNKALLKKDSSEEDSLENPDQKLF